MKKKLKKYISILTIISVMFVQTIPAYVFAEEVTPSPQPSTTTEQTSPNPAPSDTNLNPTPTATPEQSSAVPTPTTAPDQLNTTQIAPLSDQEREARRAEAEAAWIQQYYASHPELGIVSDGKTGDTVLRTGSANNSATGTTAGNTNVSAGSAQTGTGSTSNIGNGAGSQNTGTNTSATTDNTDQTNSAQVGNNITQSSISGHSSTSFNVGNSTLTTGDSNVSGTAITGVNTNLSNVAVSEFNVVDNQKGDLILSPQAFAANCISGCSASNAAGAGSTASNPSASSGQVGNGALSTNTANNTNTTNTNTNQTNTADVGNNLTLTANSGDNTGSFNTGGDTTINTGDANVNANSITFANNNIAGGVTFGVVNIYGNLEGDIVLPEFTSIGSSTANNSIAGNGSGSTGTNSSNTTATTNTSQNNDVKIANNVIVDGTTGNNGSNDNTNGNTTINTGQTTTDTNILNIANSNITDGTWWLVLVNQAGNWAGQLLGAPDGAQMAGSSGTQFKTDANGQVTASNGAGSTSTSNVSNTTNTNTTQSNTADINNTLHLSANTGGNRTDFNTGGKNIINTGDSKIISNLINLVNNNISGTGKLVVTIVNVFGSWSGDFVTPGQQKRNNTASSPSTGSHSASSGQAGQVSAGSPATDSNTTKTPTQVNGKNVQSTNNPTASLDKAQVGTSGTQPTQNSNDPEKVAGMNSATQNNDGANALVSGKNKKVITINLAWLVLAIPFLAGYFIIKKRHAIVKMWRK